MAQLDTSKNVEQLAYNFFREGLWPPMVPEPSVGGAGPAGPAGATGATGAVGATGATGPAGAGGGALLLIATQDSPPAAKAAAFVVCQVYDPTNTTTANATSAHVTINAAFKNADALLGDGLRYSGVILAPGTYKVTRPILIPNRGFTLAGSGFTTILQAQAAFNQTDPGAGDEKALIKFEATEEAQNSVCITIKDLYLDGNSQPVSGIWLEQSPTAGVFTDKDSVAGPDATWGLPNTVTNGDVYHSILNIRGKSLKYGIGINSTQLSARGVFIHNCRLQTISTAGYYINASDVHISDSHTITSSAVNAVGFHLAGGSNRVTGCKAAYYNHTGSIGFKAASTRASLIGIEAQDNIVGVSVEGAQCLVSGVRVDTEEALSTTGISITGIECVISGMNIARRTSGLKVGKYTDCALSLSTAPAAPASAAATANISGSIQFDATNIPTQIKVDGAGVTTIGGMGTGLYSILTNTTRRFVSPNSAI